eukprot:g19673.t1
MRVKQALFWISDVNALHILFPPCFLQDRAANIIKRLEMDQTEAKSLVDQGSTLLCLDLPEGSEVGIDYASWTTGPLFKGIKMIPPGIHFFHFRTRSKSKHEQGKAQLCSRVGFFANLQPQQ